jgi:hypothetical protein
MNPGDVDHLDRSCRSPVPEHGDHRQGRDGWIDNHNASGSVGKSVAIHLWDIFPQRSLSGYTMKTCLNSLSTFSGKSHFQIRWQQARLPHHIRFVHDFVMAVFFHGLIVLNFSLFEEGKSNLFGQPQPLRGWL